MSSICGCDRSYLFSAARETPPKIKIRLETPNTWRIVTSYDYSTLLPGGNPRNFYHRNFRPRASEHTRDEEHLAREQPLHGGALAIRTRREIDRKSKRRTLLDT